MSAGHPLAAVAYRAYAEHTGGKTWDGRDMPTWEELPEKIQGAWQNVVTVSRKHAALEFLDVFVEAARDKMDELANDVREALEEV